MVKAWTILVTLSVGAMALGGCATNKLEEENARLTAENRDLRDQLDTRVPELEQALESAQFEIRDKEVTIAQLRGDLRTARAEAAAAPAQSPDQPFGAGGPTGFDDIPGVTGTMAAGEVTAVVEGDVLFASGSSTLRSQARRSLDEIARVLNGTYAGREIRVAGHTDTDPIRKSGFETNYHLGFERAFAVREYLATRGVDANRMYLASHGPDEPQSSKAESRRVEITVITN